MASWSMDQLRRGPWEDSPVLRGLVAESLWPAAAAAAAWRLSPRLFRNIADVPLVTVGQTNKDNREWLGPVLVALLGAQTAVHLLVLRARLSGAASQEALAAAAALLGWAAATASAGRQLLAYLRSVRHRHYGLFGPGLAAFVVASLCGCLVQAYFAFFVPSQWKTPIVGAGVSRETILLHARLALGAAATCVLLVVRKLPESVSATALLEIPGEVERLLSHNEHEHYTAAHEQRQLSPCGKARQLSPEVGDSILRNMLFCWAGDRIALSRQKKGQLQLGDLFEPPSRYLLHSSWGRFCRRSRRTGNLAVQVALMLLPEILGQLVLNPLCVAFDYAQPYLMQRLLRFITTYKEDTSVGLRYGFFLAFCMLATSLGATFVQQQQDWSARTLLMHMRNIFAAMLTRKIMRKRARGTSSSRSGSSSSNTTTTATASKDGGADGVSEGRVYSVLTTDIRRTSNMIKVVRAAILVPCQQLVGAWYMYRLLGAAGVLGMFMLMLVMLLTRRLILQAKRVVTTIGILNDRRVDAVNEVVQGIASVKLFGLGSRFVRAIGDRRAEQLAMLWRQARIRSLISMFTVGSLPFVSFATFAIYGLQHRLDAETIFTAIAVFKVIQRSMDTLPGLVANTTAFYVSFRRIEAYMGQPEVQPLESRVDMSASRSALGFSGATLVWDPATHPPAAATASRDGAPFALSDLSVRFPEGQLTLIGGPTGSGKSSLLAALVGEMELVRGKVLVPTAATADCGREADADGGGGVVLRDIAYVPQEPWLRNATVRDNILFGEPFDIERYEEVLRMCALWPDLNMLPASDFTEIGERGITLSGGQRQRVALARAVYSPHKILLIDDCLSAVDARTGKHILHQCLLSTSAIMAGRTRVLVTHHMAACLPHCDYVVSVQGGRIVFKGARAEALSAPEKTGLGNLDVLADAGDGTNASTSSDCTSTNVGSVCSVTPASQYEGSATPASEAACAHGKLVQAEACREGVVNVEAWRLYFAPSGGWWFVASCIGCVLAMQSLVMYKDYYLAGKLGRDAGSSGGGGGGGGAAHYWQQTPTATMMWNLAVYLGLGILSAAASSLVLLWICAGSLRASRDLHSRLLESIIEAKLRFFDVTPIGRIMARFTNDIQAVDDDIMDSMNNAMRSLVSLATTLVVISSMVPLFVPAGLVVLALYAKFAWQFMAAQHDGKRLEGAAFAPVISLFSEMIPGSGSIRAFGMEAAFMAEMSKRYAVYFSADFARRSVSRWVRIRIGIVSSLVSFATALFILANISSISSGLAGFFLIYAIGFWAESTGAVLKYTDLEISLNSVERIQQYIEIEHEAPAAMPADATLPAGWPRRGTLEVSGLVAGYTPDVPVLRGLTFSARHGEKIGVVGRTGAGKSSLSLALLRLIEPAAGRIVLDGVDIAGVGLERLRQSVTIVPQVPVLFNGTIRFNLDPFGDHPDALLLDALRRTLLLRDGAAASEGSVAAFGSLDDMVAGGGQSLSLGQCQLVALARALVRRSRLVIMDEATASVDFATDASMQQTIRRADLGGSTLLCIAHRLRTVIDYDRILVLDGGRVAEFGPPARLLQTSGGLFRRLCEDSGELSALGRLCGVGRAVK